MASMKDTDHNNPLPFDLIEPSLGKTTDVCAPQALMDNDPEVWMLLNLGQRLVHAREQFFAESGPLHLIPGCGLLQVLFGRNTNGERIRHNVFSIRARTSSRLDSA